MSLSKNAKERLIIALTSRVVGKEVSDAIDAGGPAASASASSAAASAASAAAAAASAASIAKIDSSASLGGAAFETLVVTGLLATDTILSVSQFTKGANSVAAIGWDTQANNSLKVYWTADPGVGAVVRVAYKR